MLARSSFTTNLQGDGTQQTIHKYIIYTPSVERHSRQCKEVLLLPVVSIVQN